MSGNVRPDRAQRRSPRRRADDGEYIIANGLVLKQESSFETESRIRTLLLKGFIVYLVVMGSLGCLLSSFKIPYNAAIIHIAVFVGALFSAFLYYTKMWENIGYLILFLFMLGTALLLRRYISSGFFAVVNIISEKMAYYLDTEMVQGYAESIGNRAVTVTIAMVYVGWVHAILLNALISRQMKYFAVMFCSFFFLTIPFYLECEPDMLYILMLLAGCVIVFVFRGARHTPITKTNERFEYMPGKRFINYVYSARHHLTMVLMLCVMVLLFGGIFQLFVHKTDFETGNRERSSWKIATENTVRNIYKNGILGLFNRYDSTGGLKSGVLGGVNSVSLDYETDLEVTYVPYSADRMYLHSFTGDTYIPFENRWQRSMEYRIEKSNDGHGTTTFTAYEEPAGEETTGSTAALLKKRYEKGKSPSAKARMEVKNVAAARGTYLPYYVDEEGRTDILSMDYRQTYDLTFYPLLTGLEEIASGDGDYTEETVLEKSLRESGYPEKTIQAVRKAARARYTQVPDENLAAVDALINEAGLSKYRRTDGQQATQAGDLIRALADYYQEHIPYTYQPGITPRGTDFVNYFLSDNRRGYCAHFASAATLIFRRLGYRARYVEGYAFDSTDLAEDAKIRNDLPVKDYYKGDNLLNQDSTVVTLRVTDAMAHAWVEIETDGHWQICDITPWSDEEPPSGGFLQGLIDFLSGSSGGSSSGGEEVTETAGSGVALDEMGRVLGYGILILVAGASVILLLIFLIRFAAGRVRYARAGYSDRLVMDYRRFRMSAEKRMGRRDKEAGSEMSPSAINHGDSVHRLREAGELVCDDGEAEELIEILEKAGFGDEPIREDEYRRATALMRK